MNRNYIAIVLLVVLVAVGGVAAALATGFGPAPGGDGEPLGGSEETRTPYENTVVVEPANTETSAGDDGTESNAGTDANGGTGTAASTATPTPDPFAFVIENITECGQTCREVTATIVNQQDSAATGVTVRSEIYTDGDKIWEGSSDAGEVGAGESYTDTKTVELSLLEANSVRNNDGQVLIKTFVVTDSGTYVFKEQRNVM